jgi:hypothetical protein
MSHRIRMRFRDDSWWAAEAAARRDRGIPDQKCSCERKDCHYLQSWWLKTPPAKPGDTWRSRWALTIEEKAKGFTQGPIAGYAICCPVCLDVHAWTSATNCSQKLPGKTYCEHNGKGSCWNWTGSAEDHMLSATPSLYSVESLGGCGFHGFLTNGWLTG